MTRLSIEIADTAALTTVTVVGEIDMSNAARLGSRLLDAAAAATGPGLVVDLAGVTYLDSAGIGELAAVAGNLADRRRTLALVVPDGSPLHRLFKITRFEEAAPICSSVDAAATAIHRAHPPQS